MDGFVSPSLADHVREVLHNESYRNEMVNYNYDIARQFYSYSVVRSNLRAFISSLTGY